MRNAFICTWTWCVAYLSPCRALCYIYVYVMGECMCVSACERYNLHFMCYYYYDNAYEMVIKNKQRKHIERARLATSDQEEDTTRAAYEMIWKMKKKNVEINASSEWMSRSIWQHHTHILYSYSWKLMPRVHMASFSNRDYQSIFIRFFYLAQFGVAQSDGDGGSSSSRSNSGSRRVKRVVHTMIQPPI